ncbi:MAG: hypothetical protein P8J87_21100 [Verrucomicrobiales bacterium]|nr:hypothetical protein [Verrucomicrobiales bacterium]
MNSKSQSPPPAVSAPTRIAVAGLPAAAAAAMLGVLLTSCQDSKFANAEVLEAQVPGGMMVETIESLDIQVGSPGLPAWLFGEGHQLATGMNLRVDPDDPANKALHRWGEYRYFHLDGPSPLGRETWGELAQIGEFKDSVRIGEWKFFHPNGSKHAVGGFIDGKMHGRWQVWTEDGVPAEQAGEYANGVKKP